MTEPQMAGRAVGLRAGARRCGRLSRPRSGGCRPTHLASAPARRSRSEPGRSAGQTGRRRRCRPRFPARWESRFAAAQRVASADAQTRPWSAEGTTRRRRTSRVPPATSGSRKTAGNRCLDTGTRRPTTSSPADSRLDPTKQVAPRSCSRPCRIRKGRPSGSSPRCSARKIGTCGRWPAESRTIRRTERTCRTCRGRNAAGCCRRPRIGRQARTGTSTGWNRRSPSRHPVGNVGLAAELRKVTAE